MFRQPLSNSVQNHKKYIVLGLLILTLCFDIICFQNAMISNFSWLMIY